MRILEEGLRTDMQNRYYWKCLRVISKYTEEVKGEYISPESLHEVFKWAADVETTTNMYKNDFYEFTEAIVKFAIENMNINPEEFDGKV